MNFKKNILFLIAGVMIAQYSFAAGLNVHNMIESPVTVMLFANGVQVKTSTIKATPPYTGDPNSHDRRQDEMAAAPTAYFPLGVLWFDKIQWTESSKTYEAAVPPLVGGVDPQIFILQDGTYLLSDSIKTAGETNFATQIANPKTIVKASEQASKIKRPGTK